MKGMHPWKKRTRALAAVLALCGLGVLLACSKGGGAGDAENGGEETGADGGEAGVYYLNFKPEVSATYEEIAAKYKEETGVTVKIISAAANSYEQTLKYEIAKSEAPTIFQINGPVGYAAWREYCADLSDTELYRHLSDPSMAIRSGEGVYGIPYVIEGYGILYNEAITDRYFALSDRGVPFQSMSEVDSFAKLKSLVEGMTAKKEALGIDGVFASTSLGPGADWRWQTHLANLPLYYEFAGDGEDLTRGTVTQIRFSYADCYKNIFDLYLDNSVSPRTALGGKQVDDSMKEFALGRCAMVQNGSWSWSEMKGVPGNTISAEKIKFLPIYTGVSGEEKQGLCVGSENYFAINAKVSPDKQKRSADFLYWLFSSPTGKRYVRDRLGFTTPFDTFSEEEVPDDPLAREMLKTLKNREKYNVSWVFPAFPSQGFKEEFGRALLKYAEGQIGFDEVRSTVVDSWKKAAAEAATS